MGTLTAATGDFSGNLKVSGTALTGTFERRAALGIRVYGEAAATAHQWDIYGHGNNLRFSDNTGGGVFVVDTAVSMGALTATTIVNTSTSAPQNSLRYDASNRLDITVSASGLVTFDAVGAGALFQVNDAFRVTGAFTASSTAAFTSLTTHNGGATISAPLLVVADPGGSESLRVSSGIRGYLAITPDGLASSENNFLLGSSGGFVRYDSASGGTLTGMNAAGSDGRVAFLVAVAAGALTIAQQHASSTAENRFITTTGADLTISQDDIAIAIYDATSARWRVAKLP